MVKQVHDRPQFEEVDRAAEPDGPPVPHAQWNEVERRWELWDEVLDEWVPVAEPPDLGDP